MIMAPWQKYKLWLTMRCWRMKSLINASDLTRGWSKALNYGYKALNDFLCLSALTCYPGLFAYCSATSLLAVSKGCQACSPHWAFTLAASTVCNTLSSLPSDLFQTILLKFALSITFHILSLIFLCSSYHHLWTTYFMNYAFYEKLHEGRNVGLLCLLQHLSD